MLRNMMFIGIITTFCVFALIGFTLYHNSTSSNVAQNKNITTDEITPEFDMQTINRIKSRNTTPVDLQATTVPTITPTTIPTETPILSPTESTATPTAIETITPTLSPTPSL